MWTVVTGLTEDEVQRVVLCLSESELESAHVLHRGDRFALFFSASLIVADDSNRVQTGSQQAVPTHVRLPEYVS